MMYIRQKDTVGKERWIRRLKEGRTGHHEFFGIRVPMNHTCIRMLYSLPVMSTDATPWKVADVVYHLLKDFTVRQSAFGLLSRNVEKGAGLKQTILKRLEIVTSMNYHLLLSKGTWSQGSFQTYSFDFQLSLICQASRSCRVWQEQCSGTRLEVARKLVCHPNDFMLTIMRRGLANWIWVFFAIGHRPSFTQSQPPRMSRTTFYVGWHCILKFVMSQPKVRTFCNTEWPDSGKFCGSIAYLHSTTLCPYAPKTDKQ